ncbi:MAG: hypothetical protein DHS20C01_15520 [marine bacterium B5-7]|nr:MAG: hypothetical protein DHS20C01_15520 [marine bacterium B5-7]
MRCREQVACNKADCETCKQYKDERQFDIDAEIVTYVDGLWITRSKRQTKNEYAKQDNGVKESFHDCRLMMTVINLSPSFR